MDGAAMGELLARLAAMEARLDKQEAVIATQAEEIASLKAPSDTPATRPPMSVSEPRVKRRGMLRKVLGATAAAALLTAAKEAGTAEAAARGTILSGAGSSETYGVLATVGASADPTSLIANITGATAHAVIGSNASPGIPPVSNSGVLGQGSGSVGVIGLSANNNGVHGEVSGFGAGVFGEGRGSGIGIWGNSTSRAAIYGTSTGGLGIFGVTKATSPGSTPVPPQLSGVAGQGFGRIGVQGVSDSAYGVLGQSTSAQGVRGESSNGVGIFGQSTSSHGCGGTTASSGQAGLFGLTSVNGAVAMLGVHTVSNGTAAYFQGTVTVVGGLQVIGGPKNALVPHPDGSHRRMYSMEAPEAWFEDFGTAELKNGQAVVTLDPDFDAVVRGDDYLVFTMPEGDCNGLYVSRKDPHRFVVEELRGGKSTLTFSYRLVSRRKEDVGKRLEKVQLPAIDVEKLKRDVQAATAAKPTPGKPSEK